MALEIAVTRSIVVLCLAAACSRSPDPAPAPPPSPPPATTPAPAKPALPVTEDTAMAAYNAKDWAGCADQFAKLVATVKPTRRAETMYSAACCLALAGQTDKAFETLDDAVAAGFIDAAQLDKDTDLVGLRADPRWAKLKASVANKVADVEKSLTKPALRKELLEMVDLDQKVLLALAAKKKAGETVDFKSAEPMTKAHTKRLVEIVKADGWPGKSMVGDDGAHAAWLLTQHSDLDLAFQKDVLARMKPMVESGEVSAVDYAYLEDRVAVAEHRPQRYGTQFDNHQQPQPIEDEAHLDERRKAIGMPSMAEYREMMRKMYGSPK